MTTPPVTPRAALILSHDALGGALIGASLELLGWRPVFPAGAESAQAALRRIRPAVILLDCNRTDAAHRGFVGPAVMRGSPVILFGAARGPTSVEAHARLLRIPWFTVPIEPAALQELMERTVAHTAPNAPPVA